jgi:hypothetical protein
MISFVEAYNEKSAVLPSRAFVPLKKNPQKTRLRTIFPQIKNSKVLYN